MVTHDMGHIVIRTIASVTDKDIAGVRQQGTSVSHVTKSQIVQVV